jgi:hypothetical protein
VRSQLSQQTKQNAVKATELQTLLKSNQLRDQEIERLER